MWAAYVVVFKIFEAQRYKNKEYNSTELHTCVKKIK